MFSLSINGSHLCKLITIDDSYSFIKYYCIISGSDVINVSSVSTTIRCIVWSVCLYMRDSRCSLDLAKVSPLHREGYTKDPDSHHLCSCLHLDVSTIDYLGEQGWAQKYLKLLPQQHLGTSKFSGEKKRFIKSH